MGFRDLVSRIKGERPGDTATTSSKHAGEPASLMETASFLILPEHIARLTSCYFRSGETISGTIFDNRAATRETGEVEKLLVRLVNITSTVAEVKKSSYYGGAVIPMGDSYMLTQTETRKDILARRRFTCSQQVLIDTGNPENATSTEEVVSGRHYAFNLVVPLQSFTGTILPPSLGQYGRYFIAVSVHYKDRPPPGEEDYCFQSHDLRIMASDPYPGEPILPPVPPFRLQAPYTESLSILDDYDSSLSQLEVEVPHKKKGTAAATGRCILAVYAPKGRLHNGMEIPIVIKFVAQAPPSYKLQDFSFQDFRPFLPFEERQDPSFVRSDGLLRDGVEYYFQTGLRASEPPPHGDGVSRWRLVRTYANTLRFEHADPNVVDESRSLSTDSGDFELRSCGWSKPFQDPTNSQAWSSVAFVRAWARITDEMPSSMSYWGGDYEVLNCFTARTWLRQSKGDETVPLAFLHRHPLDIRNRGEELRPPPYAG